MVISTSDSRREGLADHHEHIGSDPRRTQDRWVVTENDTSSNQTRSDKGGTHNYPSSRATRSDKGGTHNYPSTRKSVSRTLMDIGKVFASWGR